MATRKFTLSISPHLNNHLIFSIEIMFIQQNIEKKRVTHGLKGVDVLNPYE